MKQATLKNITLNKSTREIIITVYAKDSIYVQEQPKGQRGFPYLVNSAIITDGLPYLLEYGNEAIQAMKGNKDFMNLIAENERLSTNIKNSTLATRVKQLLSSLPYEDLTDFQAKCALLIEKELQ